MFSIREDGVVLYDGEPITCHHCGRVLTKDDLIDLENFSFREDEDGNEYCNECATRLRECRDCGRVYHRDNMYSTECGDIVCEECKDDHYYTCEDCGDLIHEDDLQSLEMWDGGVRDLCSCCAENYYYCDSCERYVNCDDVRWNDDDEPRCPDCYEEEEGDDTVIQDYHYTSVPGYGMEFLGVKERTKKCMLGIELEVESRDGKRTRERNDDAEEVMQTIGESHVVVCNDCSLDHGFEIISCPATLSHHRDTLHWEDGLRKLIELRYRSHDGGHCGLHVHIDRKYFEGQDKDEVEAKFFLSFRNNIEWIKVFSRRRDYGFCVPNGYNDSEVSRIDKFVVPPDKAWVKSKKQRGRHCALNFNPSDTIEIRIFRGTLKYESFMATLEFVTMWAFLVKSANMTNICELNLDHFKALARRNRLNHFLEYVKTRIVENPPETSEAE